MEIDGVEAKNVYLAFLQQHSQHENMNITYGLLKLKLLLGQIFQAGHAKQLTSRRPFCILCIKLKVDEADNSQKSDDSSNASQQQYDRWMVITKGCGHQLLNSESLKPGFGLYAALNAINPEHITNMGLKATTGKMSTFAGNNPKGGKETEFRKEYLDVLKRMAGIAAGKIKSDKEV